jgi:DNA invertase Pin-like site-specific DNA recombinase
VPPRSDRPELARALSLCRVHRAKLLIAKIDRLERNVHFISGLMESNVDFVAVDFSQANRLTVHILAAVAEHEAQMISERTKAALRAAKRFWVATGATCLQWPNLGQQQASWRDNARRESELLTCCPSSSEFKRKTPHP